MHQVIHDIIIPLYYFNIEDEEMQIVVLMVPQICLIYSNHFKEEAVSILSKEIEFQNLSGNYIAGNKEIIKDLFQFNKLEYSVLKHLIIYKCENVSNEYMYAPGEMHLASLNDLETLIMFNISFKKEYNGEEVSYEEARDFILSGIHDETLFIWKNKNQICSIAQVIFREGNDYPEIGHVFTKSNVRRKGFGPSLTHKLTKYLIAGCYQKCMLYTDGNNQASNRAFVKIGYVSVGEYIKCYFE